MKLVELQHAVDFTLASPSILHRVQRLCSRRGAVAVGLTVPRRGLLRTGSTADDEAYCRVSETAVYDAGVREATTLPMSTVASRVLLTLKTTRALLTCFHAGAWRPSVTALR
jgi:hypothetical protein